MDANWLVDVYNKPSAGAEDAVKAMGWAKAATTVVGTGSGASTVDARLVNFLGGFWLPNFLNS